jgi:diguanylate cyclase (GGDEF)-like protein
LGKHTQSGILARARAELRALARAEANPVTKAGLLVVTGTLTVGAATLRLSLEAHLALSLTLLVPTLLIAWYLGLGWGLAAATFVVLSWFIADLIAVVETVPPWVVYVNAAVRLLVFCLMAYLAASLRRAYREQRMLATQDPLTGLANRRQFMVIAESERRRAARSRNPMTLAFLDLDGFKQLNDSEGHRRGDEALRLFGRHLRERLRSMDCAARVGGDEFVVLLPDTDAHGGPQVIAELQKTATEALAASGFGLGASAGVVTFQTVPASVDDMLQAADRLMYEAKTQGRGGLCCAAVAPGPNETRHASANAFADRSTP